MKSQDHFMHVDVWYDEAHGNSDDDDDDDEGDREVPSARKGQTVSSRLTTGAEKTILQIMIIKDRPS